MAFMICLTHTMILLTAKYLYKVVFGCNTNLHHGQALLCFFSMHATCCALSINFVSFVQPATKTNLQDKILLSANKIILIEAKKR